MTSGGDRLSPATAVQLGFRRRRASAAAYAAASGVQTTGSTAIAPMAAGFGRDAGIFIATLDDELLDAFSGDTEKDDDETARKHRQRCQAQADRVLQPIFNMTMQQSARVGTELADYLKASPVLGSPLGALAVGGITTWAADALRAKGKLLEAAPDQPGLGAAVERSPLPCGHSDGVPWGGFALSRRTLQTPRHFGGRRRRLADECTGKHAIAFRPWFSKSSPESTNSPSAGRSHGTLIELRWT